jgi:RsiW-degrading membrane proteinase PrsW (M82 family)
MDYFRIILYLVFGLLPSLVWLFYYLKKDLHPEPRRMIVKVFLLGAAVTIPVFFIQIGLSWAVNRAAGMGWLLNPTLAELVKWIVAIALVEEFFKYLVVRVAVFGSYALDEPLDIMLYLVVAALGFAAVENIIYLIPPAFAASVNAAVIGTVWFSAVRFMGATFLHTLCSGLVGYFLALASLRGRKKLPWGLLGVAIATLLHGLYDYSIINLPDPFSALVPGIILTGLMIFMLYDFNEVKKVKGICKL